MQTINIFKIMGYSGVLDIMLAMQKGSRTFSEIMFSTQLNPGVLNRHLKLLKNSKLLIYDGGFGYQLTSLGIRALEFADSFDDEYFKVMV